LLRMQQFNVRRNDCVSLLTDMATRKIGGRTSSPAC
jgi:hypothetical protein